MNDLIPVEGLYHDAKRLFNTITSHLVRPAQNTLRRRRLLGLFAPFFSKHPRAVTDLIDYYSWHVDTTDWTTQKGFLISCSFGEIERLWVQPDHFVPYEARLLRFQNAGGEAERAFFVGADLAHPTRLWALERVLMRHEILGFRPKVQTFLDLQEALSLLGIDAQMAVVLNGRTAYFLQYPSDSEVLLLRTTDPVVSQRTENVLYELSRNAEAFASWYSRQQCKLPAEVMKQVELDVEAVLNVAGEPG